MNRCCQHHPGPTRFAWFAVAALAAVIMVMLLTAKAESAGCVDRHEAVADLKRTLDACLTTPTCRITADDVRLLRQVKSQAHKICRRGA